MSSPRILARADAAEAIYGQILVTSVVAALSEDEELKAHDVFVGALLTMLVFWLAHIYAQAVARRLARREDLTWREVVGIAGEESPMMGAAVPPLTALALGWAGVLSTDAAIDLAIALGVIALFGWGFVIARRSGLSPVATLGAVALNGGFGLAIVGLKLAVP